MVNFIILQKNTYIYYEINLKLIKFHVKIFFIYMVVVYYLLYKQLQKYRIIKV
jgi:hypothetical protein